MNEWKSKFEWIIPTWCWYFSLYTRVSTLLTYALSYFYKSNNIIKSLMLLRFFITMDYTMKFVEKNRTHSRARSCLCTDGQCPLDTHYNLQYLYSCFLIANQLCVCWIFFFFKINPSTYTLAHAHLFPRGLVLRSNLPDSNYIINENKKWRNGEEKTCKH